MTQLTDLKTKVREEFDNILFTDHDGEIEHVDDSVEGIMKRLDTVIDQTAATVLQMALEALPKGMRKCLYCGTSRCDYISTACPAWVNSSEYYAEAEKNLRALLTSLSDNS